VTTREDQSQSVVFESALGGLWFGVSVDEQESLRAHRHVATATDVDGPASRDGRQPRARVGRNTLFAPCRECPGEGVLHALFGDVEVSRDANRGRHHERPLRSVSVRNGGRDGDVVFVVPDGQLHDSNRSNFDPAKWRGNVLGDSDRGVKVVGFDDVVTTERLFGLRERSVGGHRSA